MHFIKCPFNYTGGKYNLLSQIIPLFKKSDVFLDLFCGGGNVGVNISASQIILNDSNTQLISLIQHIQNINIDDFLNLIDELIKNYGLSNTYKYGYGYYDCDSSKGLAKYNKDRFLKLRDDYNREKTNLAMLYVLIVYAFNNQIRFNLHGEYNLPVGKRDFNINMRKKLIDFSSLLKSKNIKITNLDFRQIDILKLNKNTFIYCDPPYLITRATYNENNNWGLNDEQDLINFLDKLDSNGFYFALSNVVIHGFKKNDLLLSWIDDKKYKCHDLDKTYSNSNYQKKNKNGLIREVLVTNY